MAAFFLLGTASDLAWNCIYMSVVYFEAILGKNVISDLGLAQNIPWLFVMLLVYVLTVPGLACGQFQSLL